MGLINLTKTALKSEIVRKAVAGENKTRQISRPANQSGNWFTRVIGSLWGGITTLSGWLLAGLNFIGFSAVAVWNWLKATVTFIANFNWNLSDQAIDQQLRNLRISLVGQMGETAGEFVGFLVCGVVPAVVIAQFNQALGAYVLKEVSEEAFDELMANLRVLLTRTTYTVAQHVFYSWFKSTRRAIKADAANPNSQIGRVGRSIFGESFNKWVQAWGEPSTKPWSFSGAINETIESLPDGYIQEFVEEFYDGFLDGCSEAGFVVASAIDRFFAEQRLQKQTLLGQETILEVIPNRKYPDEKLLVAGAKELVKTTVVNTLSHYELLDNRDVGQIVGESVRDNIQRQNWEFQIRIMFRDKKEPPFRDGKKTEFKLEGIKLNRLEWDRIKRLCGGVNGYLWGRFMCRATCSNGSYPTIYAASKEIGTDFLENFVDEMTDYEVLYVDPIEETKSGKRREYDSLYKEDTRMYPAWVTIFHKSRVLNEENGRAEKTGIYKSTKYRLPLYTDKKPLEWDETIADILKERNNSS